MLLAFDTATPAVTVAVHHGTEVLAESTQVDVMRHGELLAPAIERVLAQADIGRGDLTGIAVGVGPGPFTGLRGGLVTARTMGAVLGVPVSGVCTLDVLAAEAQVPGRFVVATDARRKEVYWATYSDPLTRVDGPHVSKPADLLAVEVKVQPGASFGWHIHRSAVAALVQSGTLTLVDGSDPSCTKRQIRAGHGFVEPANHVHLGRNEGKVPARILVMYLGAPHGQAPDVAAPPPAQCASLK